MAVRAAREILTKGECSLILDVEALPDENGIRWFNVLTNVGALIAAHTLNHPKLTVQEIVK